MAANTNHMLTDIVTTTDPDHQAAVDIIKEPGERRGSVISSAIAGGQTLTGHQIPSAEEMGTLRKVSGKIPWICYAFCIVEFAERASYYGVSGVFSNFIQFPLPEGGNGAGAPPAGTQETAGALDMGVQAASALVLLFTFLAYIFPILGGYIADTKLGRYKTIVIGVLICGVAHLIMVFGALPSVLKVGHGKAPFIISLVLLAFGAGLFKSNIAPMILDQYTEQQPYIETLKSGERVIVDPEVTMQRILLLFYGLVNVGAFVAVATTYSEKLVGYWLAYLIPGVIYFLMPAILAVLYKHTIKTPPNGTVLTNVFRIIGTALKSGGFKKIGRAGFWDSARPSSLAARGITTYGKNKDITWTDGLVEDVARTFDACKIFLFFPIYNLNDGGVGSIATSQAAAMTTNGAPNDLISNLNPLAIIIFIPILNYGIYPLMRKHHISFGRITRLTFGFMLAAVSAAIGAIIQWRVYETSPCGYHASDCSIGTGVSPLNVWAQTPMWVLGALSECFCNITAYELAYARAPKSMKGLVMSLFLFTTALSSALGEALSPVLNDPYLIWPWVGTSCAGTVLAVLCYWKYKYLDDEEFMRTTVFDDESRENIVHGQDIESKEYGSPHNADQKDFAMAEKETLKKDEAASSM